MYLRKTVKRYKGKTYVNHLLVESVATPRGPRQKVICSLGSLEPAPRAAWGRLAHDRAQPGAEPVEQHPGPGGQRQVRLGPEAGP